MAKKAETTPALGKNAFSCPHCHAFTTQHWYDLYVSQRSKEKAPFLYRDDLVDWMKSQNSEVKGEAKDRLIDWAEHVVSGEPFIWPLSSSEYVGTELPTVYVSLCYSCDKVALWLHGKMLYPEYAFSIEPNSDLSDEIKHDFREAASILDKSPRGATALLRLSLQKLCKQLGQPGKNIDTDIGALVALGLDPKIQKSLDVIRVVGNNAVHPGHLDLKDDVATATKLFSLINLIAERLITYPNEIEKLYDEKIPETTKQGIEKRDKKS